MQNIIERFNSLIPTLSGPKIVEMMRTHKISINDLTALNNHPEKKAYVESIMLKEEHEREWQQVRSLIDTANPADMYKIEAFINKWSAYDFAAQHIAEAREGIAKMYKAQEDTEWANIQPMLAYPGNEVVAILKAFIDKWKPLPNNHVSEAESILAGMRGTLEERNREAERREWEALQFSTNITEIVNHITKWHNLGIDTHASEADSRAWNIVQIAPDRMAAIRQYLTYFPNGGHAIEAREALENHDIWIGIKGSRDLFEVKKFINDHPTSIYVNEARLFLSELKQEEIAKMKRDQDKYPGAYLLNLLSSGIFTDKDLIGYEVATDNSLEILRNLMEIKENLPSLQDVQDQCKTYCAPDRTDVYLFGTPATGKTCILMGLIGAANMNTNFVESAGEYASALELYLRNGFTPGQTVKGFVATVQAEMIYNKNTHNINLVELAGEDFARNIATGRDGIVSFAEMGHGVPQLLSNDNRKVFFIIVDPTSRTLKLKQTEQRFDSEGNPMLDQYDQPIFDVTEYIVDQLQSLTKMVNLLDNPANSDIMEKVDAIHVIMTKGDKLGDEYKREKEAYDLFMRRYSRIISPLTNLCRKYGINQHPDKNLNGVPRLFTFSLGQFFPGGIYEYDDTDANNLIEIIARSTIGIRPTTLWDRFCETMNKPII